MGTSVEDFYDAFSARYFRDYVQGNLRVQRQMAFFAEGVPTDAQKILIVGCGSGESAVHLVTHVARSSQVLAVDLSSESILMAERLCPHSQVTYRQADILRDEVGVGFNAVLLPDLFEHIPTDQRGNFGERLAAMLSPKGCVLMTCPAPSTRRTRRRAAGELQVIDEDIHVEDLLMLASDLDARLSFYRLLSIWHPNDYFHAMLERESDAEADLTAQMKLPIKGWRAYGLLERWGRRLRSKLRLDRLAKWQRKRQVQKIQRP